MTCGPLAPIARSSPSSRVRCDTRIVNVLKMMKPPTSRPTPAKPSSASLRIDEELVDRLAGLVGDDRGRRDLVAAVRLARVEPVAQRPLHLPAIDVPGTTRTLIASKTPGAPNTRCAVCGSNAAKLTAPKSPCGAELEQADELELLGLALEQDLHPVADLEAVAARGADVHRDLAVARRAAPLGDPGRPDLVAAAPRDPERRRARGLDRRRRPCRRTARSPGGSRRPRRRPGTVRDRVDQALGEPLAGAVAVAERRLAPHDEVDAGRVLREERAERLLQRVGEDVGAAHERDAEDDREGGEGEAHLPGEHALDRRPPHRPHPAPGPAAAGHRPGSAAARRVRPMGLLDGHRALDHRRRLGIGRATCRRMAEEGARVAVVDIDGDRADGRRQGDRRPRATGRRHRLRRARSGAVDDAADAARRPVDRSSTTRARARCTASTSGRSRSGTGSSRSTSPASSTASGPCIPHLLANGDGRVVSTASISGTRPAAGEAPYSAAKAAVVALTANAALEYGPTVRVNAVSPGMIRTALTEPLFGVFPDLEKRYEDDTPVGRVGEPEDIADVVVFLCSDLARFVTGQNLVVDGGLTLHGSGVDGILDRVEALHARTAVE